MLASAAQRLLHLDHCRFDGAAVVLTDNAQGYRAARQLAAAGTRIAAVVDHREQPAERAGAPFPVIAGHTVLSAQGSRHVASATIGDFTGRPTQTIDCRWIIEAVGFTPANSLLYHNGCKLTYQPDRGHAIVTEYAAGMHSAGAVNGIHQPEAAANDGRRAGLAAAAALLPQDTALAQRLAAISTSAIPTAGTASFVAPGGKKNFICLCEDVTEKDVCDAIAEGYSNVETLKRFSTVSMGPCQGKMCQSACIAICARENKQPIEAAGVTTARPPEQPLPLGLLAGRTLHFSLIASHADARLAYAHGAKMMDAGDWKRPQVYTTVEAEYDAVRNRAGLIDVSTLGKIELRGRDVVRFLEFVYPNRFENLRVGRVRYGVICDDAGILLDDGTIARLGEDRYFLTDHHGQRGRHRQLVSLVAFQRSRSSTCG